MKVNVYVDGFNLYYGALKGQPYRWLDLEKFARGLLHPSDSVHRVRYFTARVKPTAYDVDAPTRQASYLRALSTLPSVSIHYGQFLASVARMPKADGTGLVQVMKTEEKGSDVNLATHLLLDASVGDFETALVVTNDSDLCEPIRQVRLRFDLPVGVVLPILNLNGDKTRRKPSVSLIRVASFDRRLEDNSKRRRLLAGAQFPNILTDANGTFTKPAGW